MSNIEKVITQSTKWNAWVSSDDIKTCYRCSKLNGRIFSVKDFKKPPLHIFCRCVRKRLFAIVAGTSTINGRNGADWFLKKYRILPNYYIDRKVAIEKGWEAKKGNLSVIAPDKMIFGGIYKNIDSKLPISFGRIWYEADINYIGGYRNEDRILFSNDGLIFVSYNHYNDFIEII